MAGWFKVFSDFARSGATALDRYAQLHQMDVENQMKRRSQQIQEEQFKQSTTAFNSGQVTEGLKQESLRNAIHNQKAQDFTANMVPGQQLTPSMGTQLQEFPELAGRFDVQGPSQTLTQPGAFQGVDFNAQAPAPRSILQKAILPSFEAPRPGADTDLKGAYKSPDFFLHPDAEPSLKTLDLPGSTTYLGTPQEIAKKAMFEKAIEDLPPDAQAVARVQFAGLPGFSLSDFAFRPNAASSGTDTNKFVRSEAIRLGFTDPSGTMQPEDYMMRKDPEKYQAAVIKAKTTGSGKATLSSTNFTPEEIAGFGGMIAQNITVPGGLITRMDENLKEQLLKSALSAYRRVDVANLRAQTKADEASLRGLTALSDRMAAYEGATEDNLKLILNGVENIPDVGSMTLNDVVRRISNEFGNPDTLLWYDALAAGLTEYAAITQNPNLTGVLADAARKRIAELLPTGSTPDQAYELVKQMITQMGNRARNITDQIEQVNMRSKARTRAILDQIGGGGNSGNTPEIPHNEGDKNSPVTSDHNGNKPPTTPPNRTRYDLNGNPIR